MLLDHLTTAQAERLYYLVVEMMPSLESLSGYDDRAASEEAIERIALLAFLRDVPNPDLPMHIQEAHEKLVDWILEGDCDGQA